MKHTSRLWTLVALGLSLVCVAQLTGLSREAGLDPFEPSRDKVFELAESTIQFLEELEDELLLTYYASSGATLPSNMRHLREDVELVLRRFAEAGRGRVHYEIVLPEEQPELRPYLTELGLSTFRARSLEQEGWSELELWSSLRISRGATTDAVLHAVTPEMVPGLQSLIVEQARATTVQPNIALAAPGGMYLGLEQLLARTAQVTRLDLDRNPTSLPPDIDLLFWLDPAGESPSHLRMLAAYLEAGRPAILAAAPGDATDAPEVLFAEYGVPIAPGSVRGADESGTLLCTAYGQDFRPLGGQPNGNLHFDGARVLQLEQTTLLEQRRTAHALASSTADTVLVSSGATKTAPRSPLLLLLASEDPLLGSLVLAASSTPFRDAALADDSSAHRALVRILTEELASPAKLIWNRASIARTRPIAELSASRRALWRGVTIFLVPAVWLGIALVRLGRRQRASRVEGSRRPLLVALGCALGASALVTLVSSRLDVRLDSTAARVHAVSDKEKELLEQAVAGSNDARIELFFSPAAELPPELRVPARSARSLCRDLARSIPLLQVEAPALRVARGDDRLSPRLVTSRDDETTRVRRVTAGLRIHLGDRSTVLDLTETADYQNLRFRLVFAFWRLAQDRSVRVSVAAPAGRLSAAEGEFDYRAAGLFAPTEGDAFAHARQLLARNDFELDAIDPASPASETDPDLLLWLQPRRDIGPMLRYATDELARGGNVILAAQHYEILPRQLRRDEMELSFWPRPQHTDLERGYLPGLGIDLVREIFLDAESAPLTLGTRIERRLDRNASGHELEQQFSAQPFVVRALASRFTEHPIVRGVGDLMLPSPNRLEFDPELAAPHAITTQALVLSSQRVWKHDWKGGNLSPEVLTRPDASSAPDALPASPLAALFEGRFPRVEFSRQSLPDGSEREVNAPGPPHAGPPGKLLLVGSSSMFEDSALASGDFDNGQFLLHAAVQLTLGEKFCSLLSRRLVSPGFTRPSAETRLAWRLFVFGSGPLGAGLLALWLFTLRARSRRARISPQ